MVVATQLWWYTARSSGIIAWILLTLSVLWGLALSTKVLGKRPRPNWLLDLHRYLGGLSVLFTGLHLASLALDGFVGFGVVELLVPMASDYKPGAVAWGVIAMYLLAAVQVSSMARKHLSKQAWRSIHHLSFPLFFMATAHGILAGTDRQSVALRATLIIGTAAIAILTAVRATKAEGHDLLTSPRVR